MPLLPALRSEILKRSCDPLLQDPFGESEQVDQFLGPQIYTWAESMSILGILFAGEEEAMIHRVAMAIWECEHPWDKVSWQLMLSLLIKIPME
jgi:hypothetical protein